LLTYGEVEHNGAYDVIVSGGHKEDTSVGKTGVILVHMVPQIKENITACRHGKRGYITISVNLIWRINPNFSERDGHAI